jgi:integrase
MLYRRGDVWWWKFVFAGKVFRESSKTDSKELARRAENKRRRELEEGFHGLKKRQAPLTFKSASDAWLEMKKPSIASKTYQIEKTNLGHILPILGQKLLTDIDAADISRYQRKRLDDKAAPKTVNLEVGTIRAILRRYRLWASLQPDVRMLPTPDDIGKALSHEDEKKLLDACAESRSRSLLPAVLLALNTGMRYSELRLLHWQQVDLDRRTVRVGKSKTEAGTGRTIPLNDRATKILQFWADQFPNRELDHFVFPSERYGAGGDKFEPTVYDINPMKPITSWKEAWKTVRRDTEITIRFHDLRHTCVTRMLEGGVPLSVVASILGWSPATTARMAKRYGHIGHVAQRQAVAVLDRNEDTPPSRSAKKGRRKKTGGKHAPLKPKGSCVETHEPLAKRARPTLTEL